MSRRAASAGGALMCVVLLAGAARPGSGAGASGSIPGISACGARPSGAVYGARTAPYYRSNCAGGTFDDGQAVLARDGQTINGWGSRYASDERSAIWPQTDWAGHGAYLFFVASGPKHTDCCGVQVLSSVGSGPGDGGQWTFQ